MGKHGASRGWSWRPPESRDYVSLCNSHGRVDLCVVDWTRRYCDVVGGVPALVRVPEYAPRTMAAAREPRLCFSPRCVAANVALLRRTLHARRKLARPRQ